MTWLAWLIVNPTGRRLALVALAVATGAIILWRAFAAGQSSERGKQVQRTLERVQQKVRTDEDVHRLSPDARRERLRQWARG